MSSIRILLPLKPYSSAKPSLPPPPNPFSHAPLSSHVSFHRQTLNYSVNGSFPQRWRCPFSKLNDHVAPAAPEKTSPFIHIDDDEYSPDSNPHRHRRRRNVTLKYAAIMGMSAFVTVASYCWSPFLKEFVTKHSLSMKFVNIFPLAYHYFVEREESEITDDDLYLSPPNINHRRLLKFAALMGFSVVTFVAARRWWALLQELNSKLSLPIDIVLVACHYYTDREKARKEEERERRNYNEEVVFESIMKALGESLRERITQDLEPPRNFKWSDHEWRRHVESALIQWLVRYLIVEGKRRAELEDSEWKREQMESAYAELERELKSFAPTDSELERWTESFVSKLEGLSWSWSGSESKNRRNK